MSTGSLQKTLAQTAIYAVGIGASKGVALLLVPLYTRQMPPASVAVWDLCTTSVLFTIALVEIGMASAMARFYIQADNENERRAVSRTAMSVVILMSIITVASAWFFREQGAKLFLGDADLGELVALAGLVAALTVLSNQPLAQLRAQERAVTFSLLNLVRAIAGPASIVYLVVVRDQGVRGILIGDAIGLGAMAFAGIIVSGKYAVPALDLPALRKMLSFGLPLVPVGLSTAIILVSDRFFLRDQVGLEELAVYTIGFKVAMIMALVTQALQIAWPPSAFRIAKQPDAHQTLAHAFRIMFFTTATLALFLSAAAPELVRLFAPGDAYHGAERIVPLIAFSYALQSSVLIMTTNLVISNRTELAMIEFCLGAAVKLVLNALLIPLMGIEGAAFATLAAFAFQIVICYAFTRKVYPVPYEVYRLLAIAALVAFAAGLVMATYSWPWYSAFPARILVCAAFMAGAIGFRLMPAEEWAAAYRSVKQSAQRLAIPNGAR